MDQHIGLGMVFKVSAIIDVLDRAALHAASGALYRKPVPGTATPSPDISPAAPSAPPVPAREPTTDADIWRTETCGK